MEQVARRTSVLKWRKMYRASQADPGGTEKALNINLDTTDTQKSEIDSDILLYSEEPKGGVFRKRRLSPVTEAPLVEIEDDLEDEEEIEPQPFTQYVRQFKIPIITCPFNIFFENILISQLIYRRFSLNKVLGLGEPYPMTPEDLKLVLWLKNYLIKHIVGP